MLKLEPSAITDFEEMDQANASTLPAWMYTNESFQSIENTVLFEKNWQLVGHLSQLQQVGDQIISSIGRVPIVVVRNEQNQLKAFHNVCRHRAGPVATENGNSKALRCKYHGWTYNLDGALRSAPEMKSTENFDLCQHHLPEAKLTLWQGLVFVCISGNPPSIEELLAGITETILPIDIAQMEYSHRDEFLIDCNWKVYMDNYLEGYHLPYVHPGLSKILDYRSYNTTLFNWYSYQNSPLGAPSAAAEQANFYGDGEAHYFCIFPNIMFNILPGRLQTNIVIPENGKTRVIFDYYYTDINCSKTELLISKDKDFSDEVQLEDIDICEKVQQGLNSGSYQSGKLCMKRENGVLHFQNLIRQAFRQAIENKQFIIK